MPRPHHHLVALPSKLSNVVCRPVCLREHRAETHVNESGIPQKSSRARLSFRSISLPLALTFVALSPLPTPLSISISINRFVLYLSLVRPLSCSGSCSLYSYVSVYLPLPIFAPPHFFFTLPYHSSSHSISYPPFPALLPFSLSLSPSLPTVSLYLHHFLPLPFSLAISSCSIVLFSFAVKPLQSL